MKISQLQIQDLETMQDLTSEETLPVQGGLSILQPTDKLDIDIAADKIIRPEGRLAYPLPIPCAPWPPRPICTNFPTKGGHLPWCAVIL